MKSDSSSNSIDALGERIERAREKPEEAPSGAGMALRMGCDMVAGVLVGAGFGFFIDKTVGTMPLFLVTFLFIGAAAGIKMMIETSNRYHAEETEEES